MYKDNETTQQDADLQHDADFALPHSESGKLVSAEYCMVENMWMNFLWGVTTARGGDYLGFRPWKNEQETSNYVFHSYTTIRDYALNLAQSLMEAGYPAQSNIGIYSINIPEWIVVELACYAGNYVVVPMYDTFGEDALSHIVNQTEMRVVFADGKKMRELFRLPVDVVAQIETIVVMDDDMPTDKDMSRLNEMFAQVRIPKLFRMSQMKRNDDDVPPWNTFGERKASFSDVATICYTSGTTGMPKGVMLTHGNLLAELGAFEYMADRGKMFRPGRDDIHISYLPLAHVFERIIVAYMTRSGGKIGFFSGSKRSDKLMEDIGLLRPTVFVSVPRLYNRIYDAVMNTVKKKSKISRFLFDRAVNRKLGSLRDRGKSDDYLLDCLVFDKLKQYLGGRVRVMVCGSAPIGDKVLDFLRIAFGAEVYEGYGQTETTAATTVTIKGETQSGHVGIPLPCCEVKLVPLENGLSSPSSQQIGEILVRGNQVFVGYYKDDAKTADAFDDHGWYKTGDVGRWDKKGRLVIVDRVKSMFKLAQGEYVAPEKVETIVSTYCDYVDRIFVDGNPLQSYLIAIVVPNREAFPKGEEPIDLERTILEQIRRTCREQNLKGFEIPHRIHIADEFPPEIITPTFKVKRNEARRYFADVIGKMYETEQDSESKS